MKYQKELENVNIEELLQYSNAQLTDMGFCPTCVDRLSGHRLYGDDTQLKTFEDEDIECLFVPNPRADGHMMISTQEHYHDLSEAPDHINEKIIRFTREYMKIIQKVYGCERVYLCTMSDGPMNHYHVQLIPRYKEEERGSKNFVKPRHKYVYDEKKFKQVCKMIKDYAQKQEEINNEPQMD